ncbi:MAG: hypothetical protein ACOH5I_06665 [Oligoflexus sp.]
MNSRCYLAILCAVIYLAACRADDSFHSASNSEERQFGSTNEETEPQESGNDTTDSELLTASEPVSIGGAFLTCRYPADQAQISEQFALTCKLNDVPEIEYAIVEAKFYKTDMSGVRHAMDIQEENLTDWSWNLIDRAATLHLKMIELDISFDGESLIKLNTRLENSSLSLTVDNAFWLAGEPNNLIPNDPNGENCVEFRNIVGRNVHFQVTGLTSPPLGRFNDLPCQVSLRYLCRHNLLSGETKWLISENAGTFDNYPNACPESYHFSLPLNNQEVLELIDLVDINPNIDVRVWVALHDQNVEGQFEYIVPE